VTEGESKILRQRDWHYSLEEEETIIDWFLRTLDTLKAQFGGDWSPTIPPLDEFEKYCKDIWGMALSLVAAIDSDILFIIYDLFPVVASSLPPCVQALRLPKIGGSQCAELVAGRIFHYLLNTNAQISSDYTVSAESTHRVAGPVTTAEFFQRRVA
jgi:hypothetical protein